MNTTTTTTTLLVALLLTAGTAAANDACRSLDEEGKARLVSFVEKKYKLGQNASVKIAEDSAVEGSCYRKLRFQSQSPQRSFGMTLYLSPDQTFLLPELFDVRIDPLEEERRKNREVMASLVQGRLSSMGPADAKVTIVEFSDFQCPYCRQSAGMLKTFLATPEAKDVRFVFRHFPLTMHPWAKPAAEAAACASFQDQAVFWKMHDWLFENQTSVSVDNVRDKLLDVARASPGFDVATYQGCLDDALSLGTVLRDTNTGVTNRVTGTPTFFVNGRRVQGFRTMADLHAAVAEALEESAPPPRSGAGAPSPGR